MKTHRLAVIDFETTGKDPYSAEVLQCAVIDEKGLPLLCKLYKPERCRHWDGAERVHGISPARVENCAPFASDLAAVANILNAADEVVAYNASYEIGILLTYGAKLEHKYFIDPMLMFAKVYGAWNAYYGNYKWQKLTTAANYYGYDFPAHDALGDVKATLHVLNNMLAAGVKPQKVGL